MNLENRRENTKRKRKLELSLRLGRKTTSQPTYWARPIIFLSSAQSLPARLGMCHWRVGLARQSLPHARSLGHADAAVWAIDVNTFISAKTQQKSTAIHSIGCLRFLQPGAKIAPQPYPRNLRPTKPNWFRPLLTQIVTRAMAGSTTSAMLDMVGGVRAGRNSGPT
jgi:hypothetical protein